MRFPVEIYNIHLTMHVAVLNKAPEKHIRTSELWKGVYYWSLIAKACMQCKRREDLFFNSLIHCCSSIVLILLAYCKETLDDEEVR